MEPEQKKRWANLNAFLAQLSQAADFHYTAPNEPPNFHPIDKSLRAIWTISNALENEEHPSKTPVNTAARRAVCLWFIYAADRLWANVQNGRIYVRGFGAGPGYKRERWNVWEQGLQDAKAA